MKLLTVLVTHNRLDYTKVTIETYNKTAKVPHYLYVIDNASSDGTQLYLADCRREGLIDGMLCQMENAYPGKATNQGWRIALGKYPDATHLMRCDNDMQFFPGWDTNAAAIFAAMPNLGQLGLMSQHQESSYSQMLKVHREGGQAVNIGWGNVGGTMIIPRLLYAMGLRYLNDPWHNDGSPTAQEDVAFSTSVKSMGFFFANVMHPTVLEQTKLPKNKGKYPEYTKEVMSIRGYDA